MTLLLIALATLVTEDLTCIGVGVLIAQGKLTFLDGTLACLAGIVGGDLLLFLSGRILGRPALRWKSVARYLRTSDVDRASEWLEQRGLAAVFLSRFTPGLRLATYFAAGALRTNFWRFAGYFLLAALTWTPLLIGWTVLFGQTAARATGGGLAVFALATVIYMFCRSVRLLRRAAQWEFWPPWITYIPLIPYLLWLAVKHRSVTLFTAANPSIPSGGFVGESKSVILENLTDVAPFALIPAGLSGNARLRVAADFLRRSAPDFPVVLKPDVGERGSGVRIAHSLEELEEYLGGAPGDTIIQQYVPGLEFGVFYCRYPSQSKGHIFSITEKRFPEVMGDGNSSVGELILRDPRAACIAAVYAANAPRRFNSVPEAGASIRLVELGSHCRGAIFLDGSRFRTPALEEAIDRIAKTHPGFFFGRFDVRTPSEDDFRRGEFTVIELNGVSAEAAHIYDPAVTLLEAYRTMLTQWRIAFEIGAINRRAGVEPMPVQQLIRLILKRQARPAGPRAQQVAEWN